MVSFNIFIPLTVCLWLQYLHHGSGSGMDQEQWWQRRHGEAQQAEVCHDLRPDQCFKWVLCVSITKPQQLVEERKFKY